MMNIIIILFVNIKFYKANKIESGRKKLLHNHYNKPITSLAHYEPKRFLTLWIGRLKQSCS